MASTVRRLDVIERLVVTENGQLGQLLFGRD
jgi:hypothetical protein